MFAYGFEDERNIWTIEGRGFDIFNIIFASIGSCLIFGNFSFANQIAFISYQNSDQISMVAIPKNQIENTSKFHPASNRRPWNLA